MSLRNAKEARKVSKKNAESYIYDLVNLATTKGSTSIHLSKDRLDIRPDVKKALKTKGYKIIQYTENSYIVSW